MRILSCTTIERFLQYAPRILFNSLHMVNMLYASKLSASLFSPHVLFALHVPDMYFAIDLILQHIVYICNSASTVLALMFSTFMNIYRLQYVLDM
jgi:hypothetical protein